MTTVPDGTTVWAHVDRNSNGRYDSGEAVAGAAIRAGDRFTASDATGAYSVYNLWPGAHVIELQSVPPGFEKAVAIRTAILMDERTRHRSGLPGHDNAKADSVGRRAALIRTGRRRGDVSLGRDSTADAALGQSDVPGLHPSDRDVPCAGRQQHHAGELRDDSVVRLG